jgi:hypothetical protein
MSNRQKIRRQCYQLLKDFSAVLRPKTSAAGKKKFAIFSVAVEYLKFKDR